MSDLGLNTLTDDQLLDLLQEACAELGQRDPVVRTLAQKSIYAEADRIRVFKDSIEGAVEKARREYEASIRKESEDLVRNAVATGQWSPMTSTEEGRMAVDTEREIKQRMVLEADKALQLPTGPNLWLHIQPQCVKASYTDSNGTRQTQGVKVTQAKVDRVMAALREALQV